MTDVQSQPLLTPEAMEKASKAVARHCAELDLTSADHIALWLESNTEEPRIAWLAVQIAEAFDRALSRKHVSWGAGDPDCPKEIKAGNGELHTLRCKVCGQDISRANEICLGRSDHD